MVGITLQNTQTGCQAESAKLAEMFFKLPSPRRSASPCSGDPGRPICFPRDPNKGLGSSSILSAASRSWTDSDPAVCHNCLHDGQVIASQCRSWKELTERLKVTLPYAGCCDSCLIDGLESR